MNQEIQNYLIRAVLNQSELEGQASRLKNTIYIQSQLFPSMSKTASRSRSQLDAVQRILFALSSPYVIITNMVEIEGGYPTHTLVFDAETEVRYLLTI